MKKRGKIGLCFNCGKYGPITDDHIPPKALFPNPRPKNLITAPCCLHCNQSFARDDEYFKLVLVIDEVTKGHPERDKVVPSLERSLKRPQSRLFRRTIESQMIEGIGFTPLGICVGPQRLFKVSNTRIAKTGERIVKGLYFATMGHRVPDDYTVNVLNIRDPRHRNDFGGLDSTIQGFIERIETEKAVKVGDTFAYRRRELLTAPGTVLWLLYFYGRLIFLAMVYPRSSFKPETSLNT